MTRYLLVHPPLLGPAVWQPVARVLGADALVPDLRGCVDPANGWWERVVEVCAPLLTDDTVLVGHSGAGVVLPSIAVAGPVVEVVFVDALVPARHGPTMPGQSIREFVSALPSDTHLPRWSTWWSDDAVAALTDDQLLLQQIVAEQPQLAADFYDHAVPVPPGWDERVRCRYVRFSPAYTAVAADAAERGWPVIDLPGTHLHQVNRPDQVAGVLRAE